MLAFSKKNIFLFILFFLSILINQYYGNKGVFPVDSFSHFDTGFRILQNEHPFKDYWIVSGPFVDYLQSIFFYFFGVSWQIYVFHASLVNAILAVATFIILIKYFHDIILDNTNILMFYLLTLIIYLLILYHQ